MTQEEIIDGNKLIAEFMGYEIENKIYANTIYPVIKRTDLGYEQTKYHTSWDWLMPVVEKIEAMDGVSVFIKGASVDFYLYGFARAKKTEETKIKSTWLAVVEFINWYNNQNK